MTRTFAIGLCAAALCFFTAASPRAGQGGRSSKHGHFCSDTARTTFTACNSATRDDFKTALATCNNLSDANARAACTDTAKSDRDDAAQTCRDQRDARLEVCGEVGEDRYDPDFSPAGFDADPRNPSHPNPYFPLAVGNHWEFQSDSESEVVEIQDKTKDIEGVHCIVSHDRVLDSDGNLSEDTNDWFAHAKAGDVFYCGEQTAQYQTFPGDDPPEPELVGVEGAFKAGREGAKPGVVFPATPTVGVTLRQEFLIGEAEDVSTVVTTAYSFGHDANLDQNVPADLANALCADDCVVTSDFSALEPDVSEHKYFAPGIGVFLEVEVSGDGTSVNRLVQCNTDPKCAHLPGP
jgi:hypothetical protein